MPPNAPRRSPHRRRSEPVEGQPEARLARWGTKEVRLARGATMDRWLAQGATMVSSAVGYSRATTMRSHTSDGTVHTSQTRETRETRGDGAFFDAKAFAKNAEVAAWEGEYDVAELYKVDGTAQWLARHPLFSTVQFVVVALNIIWIGIETDCNDKDVLYESDVRIQLVENLFCLLFLGDWLVRLCAFRRKVQCLGDSWFVFDTVLLVMMIFETWVLFIASALSQSGTATWPTNLLRLVRLVRLARSARIARLLRTIPQLTVIIRGLMVVFRTVIIILVLLTLLVYVFAILFVQFARDSGLNDDGSWDDVSSAMATLFLKGLISDMAPMTYGIASENIFYAALFLVFILVGGITIMNMLIAVLVQVVGVVSTVEEETYELRQVKKLLLQNHLQLNEDDSITLQDIEALFSDEDLVSGFCSLGIDTDDLLTHSKDIFRRRSTMDLRAVWQLAVQHRGDSAVKVKDIVSLRQFVHSQIAVLVEQGDQLKAMMPAAAWENVEVSALHANPSAGHASQHVTNRPVSIDSSAERLLHPGRQTPKAAAAAPRVSVTMAAAAAAGPGAPPAQSDAVSTPTVSETVAAPRAIRASLSVASAVAAGPVAS